MVDWRESSGTAVSRDKKAVPTETIKNFVERESDLPPNFTNAHKPMAGISAAPRQRPITLPLASAVKLPYLSFVGAAFRKKTRAQQKREKTTNKTSNVVPDEE